MISGSELRKGSKILFRNTPYVVVDFQHVKPGKGGAYVKTKMKNLMTGLISEETFRSDEKLQVPDLTYKNMRYLYSDDLYHFMDEDTYEQISIDKSHIEDVLKLLKEQEVYTILYFENKPIEVAPPLFMELAVAETIPGVKGDTQGSASKPATLETGLVVSVPLFINEGDIIKVDTRDKTYIERIKK